VRAPDRFDAVYDRAALVAMKPEDRDRYVATTMAAVRPGAPIFLVSFAYSGAMTGPPFSVDAGEIRRLFRGSEIQKLDERDVLAEEPRFRDRGATAIVEEAWRITAPA
jgi:thiopurine S-methyltransferase